MPYNRLASWNVSRVPSIGKKSPQRRADQRRPRREQGEQSGVVDLLAHEAENVLFRIGRWVFLDAICHAPAQCRDVTADRHDRHPRVKCADVGRQCAASRIADAADRLRIYLRERGQIVQPAQAVPDAIARQVRAQQVERVAQHGVLATAQIKARAALGGVPELASLALPDGVVRQDRIAALRQIDVEDLICVGRLAGRRVAARTEDPRHRSADLRRACTARPARNSREGFRTRIFRSRSRRPRSCRSSGPGAGRRDQVDRQAGGETSAATWSGARSDRLWTSRPRTARVVLFHDEPPDPGAAGGRQPEQH